MSLSANTRLATRLVGVVLVMGALAWAAVPFYNWFCRTTGYGGTTNVAERGSDVILNETVTIRFDANVAKGMEWEFRPVQNEMTLRIGETGLAFYEAYNPTDRVIAGAASYNVSPDLAGYYFDKIECFCFTEQVLQPVDDRDAGRIRYITLSYTFYETDLPQVQAQAAPPAATPVN